MLRIERNERDGEMVNVYSIVNGNYILWGVVHSDMLGELDASKSDLDNDDIQLVIK